jgi:hypothetical protein
MRRPTSRSHRGATRLRLVDEAPVSSRQPQVQPGSARRTGSTRPVFPKDTYHLGKLRRRGAARWLMGDVKTPNSRQRQDALLTATYRRGSWTHLQDGGRGRLICPANRCGSDQGERVRRSGSRRRSGAAPRLQDGGQGTSSYARRTGSSSAPDVHILLHSWPGKDAADALHGVQSSQQIRAHAGGQSGGCSLVYMPDAGVQVEVQDQQSCC